MAREMYLSTIFVLLRIKDSRRTFHTANTEDRHMPDNANVSAAVATESAGYR
jgi:hypothetical protein